MAVKARVMTKTEALDFAADHYMAGNVSEQVSWESSNDEIEAVLAPWLVLVEGE